MKIIKGIIKFIVRFFVIIFLIVTILISYFFIANKAPASKGKVVYHVNYKDSKKLDIYLPTTTKYEKSPVLVYFHGGAWVMGNKAMVNTNRFHGSFNQLREKGYTIISPNYSLAKKGKAPFDAAITDIIDAINWVYTNASDYSIDENNMGILAESAGAHLSLMAIYSEPGLFKSSLRQDIDIKYFASVYAPTNLEFLYNMGVIDSMQLALEKLPGHFGEYLNFTTFLFDFNPLEDSVRTVNYLRKYSPINFVNEQIPPTLFIHGIADKVVPVNQTLILKDKLDSLHIENEMHLLENVNHVFRGASANQKDSVQQWIVRFIDNNYKEE